MVKNPPEMRETWVRSLGGEKIPWRRAWQPTPVFLPGQRSLVGYSPSGHRESDMTGRLSTAHTYKQIYKQNRNGFTDIENKLMDQRGKGGEEEETKSMGLRDTKYYT